MTEIPRGRPAVQVYSRLCGVGSTSFFWGLGNEFHVLQCRTAALGASGPGPSAPKVDQLSRTTCARVGVPACSTRSPGRLEPWSDYPRGRSAVLGELGLCRWAHGVDQQSWVTCASVRVPAGSTRNPQQLGPLSQCPRVQLAIPGIPGPCPRVCWVDQLSRVTLSHVQAPAVSTRCPG